MLGYLLGMVSFKTSISFVFVGVFSSLPSRRGSGA